MAKRKDRNQVLEQYSRGRVQSLLAEWVVNSLDHEDYAFDYEVRPTSAIPFPLEVYPAPFYAQLKSSRRFDDDEHVWHDFDVDFLVEDCLQSSVPVVLFIYEKWNDELNWCVAQHYCWDVLDEEREDWREQSTVRVKLERTHLRDDAGLNHLRNAVERAQRRITTRDFIATSRRQPFDHLPGATIASNDEVIQYKERLLDESTALLEAEQADAAVVKLLEVYKLPEDDGPTLEAIHSLLDLLPTDEPAVAFAKIRFASDGLELAKAFDRDGLFETFESELADAWAFVDEQFVGATYFHRDAGLELLILSVPRGRYPVGGANVLAEIQWSDGGLDWEPAHPIAANEEYELVESGESNDPLREACSEREHVFDTEALRMAPTLAKCAECGLSRGTVQNLLKQDVPDVCDTCGAVSYDVVFHYDEVDEEDVGLCTNCRT